MTDNKLQKQFRNEVTHLQMQMQDQADGVSVVVGTKEDPIVSDSELIPIKHYFMDCLLYTSDAADE